MSKNIYAVIITIIIGTTIVGCNNKSDIITRVKDTDKIEDGTYKDGKYEGVGKGYDGDIKVMVTVSNGKINNINIMESSDDKQYISEAKKLIPKIIEKQNIKVDTISMATISSNGIISAVENSLKKAK